MGIHLYEFDWFHSSLVIAEKHKFEEFGGAVVTIINHTLVSSSNVCPALNHTHYQCCVKQKSLISGHV